MSRGVSAVADRLPSKETQLRPCLHEHLPHSILDLIRAGCEVDVHVVTELASISFLDPMKALVIAGNCHAVDGLSKIKGRHRAGEMGAVGSETCPISGRRSPC
jgi:hypothetical protein